MRQRRQKYLAHLSTPVSTDDAASTCVSFCSPLRSAKRACRRASTTAECTQRLVWLGQRLNLVNRSDTKLRGLLEHESPVPASSRFARTSTTSGVTPISWASWRITHSSLSLCAPSKLPSPLLSSSSLSLAGIVSPDPSLIAQGTRKHTQTFVLIAQQHFPGEQEEVWTHPPVASV